MNSYKFRFESILMNIIVISLLTSCIVTQTTSQTTLINKNNVKLSDTLKLTDYVNSCRYTTLEITENSLIGEIKDIQFIENKIFVLNSVLGNNEILVFDQTGRYLNTVGSKGNGPHEYLSINSFCINNFKNYIVVFDALKQKVIKYNYSGEFLASVPQKNECGFLIKSRFISKDRMLCVNGVNSHTSTIIFECDEDLGNIDVLSTSGLKCDGLYIYAKEPIAAQSRYYFNPLSNIVYKYTDKESVPAFKLDLHVTEYDPQTEIADGADYGKSFISTLQKGFFPLNGIIENDKYLLFIQNGYFTLWNKNDNTGASSFCSLSGGSKDILPLPICSVVSGIGNNFVSILSYKEMTDIKNFYQKKQIQPNEKIQKLIDSQRENDNPTIVFYQMK